MRLESPLCKFFVEEPFASELSELWPGSDVDGDAITGNNVANWVDPRDARRLEGAVTWANNAELTGREPDPRDLKTIKEVVGKYITEAATHK